MFLRGLWDVSLNGDLFETSQRHLMPAGKIYVFIVNIKQKEFIKLVSLLLAVNMTNSVHESSVFIIDF